MNTIVINNVEIKSLNCDMQQILKMLGEEKTIAFAKKWQELQPHLFKVTALPE
jgi:hypothetical protein